MCEPWREGVDVTELTDRDLQQPRNVSKALSDSSGTYRRKVEALADVSGLDYSQLLDRAVRVELAHAIDTYRVSFARDDFDVAYTIPPVGWVPQHDTTSQNDHTDADDERADRCTYDPSLPAEPTIESRLLNYTVPPVVKAMMEAAVEEGVYESETALAKAGIDRLLA